MEALLLCVAIALAGITGLAALGDAHQRAITGEARGSATRAAVGAQAGLLSNADDVARAAEAAAHAGQEVERAGRVTEGAAKAHYPAPGAMFGERTLYWELMRGGTPIFGGQRALLLQIADPRIAAGVTDFSSFRLNPMKRLTGTLDAMLSVAFGTPEERAATLAHLEEIHSRVRGRTPAGRAYSANDPRLKFWVHATLVDTALEVERRFVGHFSEADRARYYEESKTLARAFEIPESEIPADYTAFKRYMADAIEALEPDAQSRELAAYLMEPEVRIKGKRVPQPLVDRLGWVTRDILPEPLRAKYGIAPPSLRQKAFVRSLQAATRSVVRPAAAVAYSNPITRAGVTKLIDMFLSLD